MATKRPPRRRSRRARAACGRPSCSRGLRSAVVRHAACGRVPRQSSIEARRRVLAEGIGYIRTCIHGLVFSAPRNARFGVFNATFCKPCTWFPYNITYTRNVVGRSPKLAKTSPERRQRHPSTVSPVYDGGCPPPSRRPPRRLRRSPHLHRVTLFSHSQRK